MEHSGSETVSETDAEPVKKRDRRRVPRLKILGFWTAILGTISTFAFLVYGGVQSMAAVQSFNQIFNHWLQRHKHATVHLSNYIMKPTPESYHAYRCEYQKLKELEEGLASLRGKSIWQEAPANRFQPAVMSPYQLNDIILANTLLMPFSERRQAIEAWEQIRRQTRSLQNMARRIQQQVRGERWSDVEQRRAIGRLDSLNHRMSQQVDHIETLLGQLVGSVKSALLWSLLGISVIVGLGGCFLSYRYMSGEAAWRQKMRETLEEKRAMLQEIHHRVKNNLALVTGLLEMQADETEQEPVRREFRETENRIQSLAMTHEMLYQAGQFANLEFDGYLKRKREEIQKQYLELSSRLEVHEQTEPIRLSMDQAVPSALLMNELLSNAFEHGLTYADQPRLHVEARERNEIITLIVENNGACLPDHVDPETSCSLGMRLIQTLTRQLNGEIEFKKPQNDNTGTRVVIRFPKI